MRSEIGVLLLVVLLGVPGLVGTGRGVGAAPSISYAVATNFTGNFSLSGIGPQQDVPAGSTLSVQYELRDPTYSASQAGLYVHVPSPEGLFNVSWGVIHDLLPGSTVVFNSTDWTDPANTTVGFLLTNETVFPNTGTGARDRALLTTQGVAITSAEPFGALTVAFRWRWLMTPSAGANTTGAWIPSPAGALLDPGQYAQLASGGGATASPGQPVSVCLNGAVPGRVFQLQAIIPTPHLLVTSTTTVVPTGAPPPFCLGLSLPSWLDPQVLQLYVWDLVGGHPPGTGNVTTFLLYSVKLQVVPGPSPAPTLLGVPYATWYLAGTVGAGLAGALIVTAWVRRRPRRRVPGPPTG